MTFRFEPSPNRRKRKDYMKISVIVIHYTGSMSLSGTISWFKNRASESSAHYLIDREGGIIQMVADEDVAFHAGVSAMRPNLPINDPRRENRVNEFSLGIELVATPDSGYTDRQMAALYQLLEYLVNKYKIHPNRVVGHSQIAPNRKIDPEGFPPGQFNWNKTKEVVRKAYEGVN